MSTKSGDTESVDTPTDDTLSEFRVAVTVFATTHGVDRIDAGHIAVAAVRQALGRAVVGDNTITAAFRDENRPVRVAGVMETGTAAGNGYLWTEPTSKAFLERRTLR